MNIFKATLTKRYLLIVLIVILFVLSSIYGIANYVTNKSVKSQIEYRDELITKTLSTHIEVLMNRVITETSEVSPFVLTYNEKSYHFYKDEIESMVTKDSLYLFIQAVDEEGKELVKVPDIPFSTGIQIKEVTERISWSKTSYVSNLIALPDGRETLCIASPAVDENGKYKGGVIAFLNLEVLSTYLQAYTIGEQGVNLMIDRKGSIIADTNNHYIGQPISEHPLGIYLKKERYGLWNGDLLDKNMVAAYRPLSLGNVGLIVAEPIDQAMLPAKSVMMLLLKGFIFVFIIAIGLTIFGTSRVVKPVLSLIQQVKEYKENKRSDFDLVKTGDELEDLSLVMAQMAKALTEKERKLFYILESIPYGVITTDQNGRITTFNKGAEKLTLFSRKEAVGQSIFELPIKNKKEEFFLYKTLKQGKAFEEVESYIYDKEQQKHDVRLYSSLFNGGKDDLVGSILVIRDVSEIKKLEEYLKQSERLASLGQLTAGIAHEVKNPLSIIQAAAEAIQFEIEDGELDDSSIPEYTRDILESADRMNRLLTDFLKLSKGDEKGTSQIINIVQTIDELLHLLRKNVSDKDIMVYRQYEVEQALVYGNKNGLTQVILNIILNSLQAMEHGGSLYIHVNAEQNGWKIEIKDSGKGIPASKLKWIFNPFYSTKSEGTGLGLSIAHEIITQHNGNIRATSIEGEGTSIFIYLPNILQ
ncbi:ATP-binding protein [Domibacillus sp. PGB-M46]|uniref:PAS domain-containing sensor histidine kinase n=1 Tax=Domibacillus sp. PGB-M46 TaxID=2910255 RepID=UPI001F5A62A1|nr:PAS domain-containing sensor histidine kinase [Domibacillus sp. PGB-M46]MCI2256706.1 ATP-binding protein [Domibacillus sp. PGB-M46]